MARRRYYKKKRPYKKRRKMRRYKKLPSIYKFRMVLEAPLLSTDVAMRQGFVEAAINVNALSLHFNNQPGGATPPVGLTEEKDFKNLFDQYRVQWIRVSFTPHSNQYQVFVDEQQPLQSNLSGTRNQPLYIAYDVDNQGTITADNLITRRGTRVKSLAHKWKTTFRVPKTYSPNQTSLFGGWRNLQTEQANLTGVICMSTSQPIEWYNEQTNQFQPIGLSQEIGRVLIETYVEFKMRQ